MVDGLYWKAAWVAKEKGNHRKLSQQLNAMLLECLHCRMHLATNLLGADVKMLVLKVPHDPLYVPHIQEMVMTPHWNALMWA